MLSKKLCHFSATCDLHFGCQMERDTLQKRVGSRSAEQERVGRNEGGRKIKEQEGNEGTIFISNFRKREHITIKKTSLRCISLSLFSLELGKNHEPRVFLNELQSADARVLLLVSSGARWRSAPYFQNTRTR